MGIIILGDITPKRLTIGAIQNAGKEVLQIMQYRNSRETRERHLADLYDSVMTANVTDVHIGTLGLLQSVRLCLPLSKFNTYASMRGNEFKTALLGVLFTAVLDCRNEPTAKNAINLFNTHTALKFVDILEEYRVPMFHIVWETLFKERSEVAQEIIENYIDFYRPFVKHPSFDGETGEEAENKYILEVTAHVNKD